MSVSKLKFGPFAARTAKKKITLSTINNFSLDAIIQHVARHLILQNERSYDQDCMYRSEKGLTCAVGCLISDAEYDHKMEGTNISGKIFDRFNVEAKRRELLSSLQIVHDAIRPYEWHDRFMIVGYQFELDTAALKAVIDAAIAERQAGEAK